MNRLGEIFVADTYNSRVHVFSPTGVFLRKWGSAGSDDGEFLTVEALDVDHAGDVWVANTSNLYAAVGSPPGPFPDPGFTDVPPTSPLFAAIAWLASTGIAKGYADGGYHPTAPVSRQAMVQFLVELDGRFLH